MEVDGDDAIRHHYALRLVVDRGRRHRVLQHVRVVGLARARRAAYAELLQMPGGAEHVRGRVAVHGPHTGERLRQRLVAVRQDHLVDVDDRQVAEVAAEAVEAVVHGDQIDLLVDAVAL